MGSSYLRTMHSTRTFLQQQNGIKKLLSRESKDEKNTSWTFWVSVNLPVICDDIKLFQKSENEAEFHGNGLPSKRPPCDDVKLLPWSALRFRKLGTISPLRSL